MKSNKSRFILFLQNYWPLFCYILISVVFLFPQLLQKGIPFKYDWSWPIFDMKEFWHGLAGNGNLGLFDLPGKYASLLFGIPGFLKISAETSLKLFLTLSHIVASYSFYVFANKKIKSKPVSFIAGLAYGFSPYIFIRTIVGFVPSILAYAVLPIFLLKFWQTKKKIIDYLMIGLLLSLIFWQPQAGLLTFLIITVYAVLGLFGKQRIADAKNYFFSLLSLVVFSLPWLIIMLSKNGNPTTASGSAVTTLGRMSSLPHSYRNMLMLSDHEITTSFFYPLSHDKIILAGFLIVWFVALCALFSKKNRQIVLALFISSLAVIPFYKGPAGLFGPFYLWFYSHFPQIMIFRETYHFEFLFAITLVAMFAIGLEVIWTKINNLKASNLLKKVLMALFAGSAIFIIVPYFTFNYAGYFNLQKIPPEYSDLNNFLQQNSNYCHKIYYPPGLDFLYFKGDASLGASNGDSIAGSIGIPFVNGGTSILNTPSSEMFYQDKLISQFFENSDNGEFAGLLSQDGVDCVVVRQDLDTKYADAMGLTFEKDPVALKKFNQNDWLPIIQSKKGLLLDEQFGDDIYIYKPDPQYKTPDVSAEMELNVGQKATEKFANSEIAQLPLTDWADVNSDYTEGWSRGRYSFWRKSIFADLLQDFIYTSIPDSVISGKFSQNGSYDLWIRYLDGGANGNFQLKISNSQFLVSKQSGAEKFVWKDLGEINPQGGDVSIKNISGENAIADIILIKR